MMVVVVMMAVATMVVVVMVIHRNHGVGRAQNRRLVRDLEDSRGIGDRLEQLCEGANVHRLAYLEGRDVGVRRVHRRQGLLSASRPIGISAKYDLRAAMPDGATRVPGHHRHYHL